MPWLKGKADDSCPAKTCPHRLNLISCRIDRFPDEESHQAAFQRLYDQMADEAGRHDEKENISYVWHRDNATLAISTAFHHPDPITRPDGRSWLFVDLIDPAYTELRSELRDQVERQREEHHQRQTATERERRAREVERLR